MGRKTFKKVITSPELISQISPENKLLMTRFLKEKNTRCSDKTVEGYESDLNIFFVYNLINNGNKPFISIKKIEFAEFFGYGVTDLKWGSSRFARMKSCLSTLSEYIITFFDDDHPLFKNVILKAIESLPKNPTREKSIFSEEQIDGLFDYINNTLKRPQDACLLALAIGSGARVSELTRFHTDNLSEDNLAFEGMFYETLKEIKTKGRGKLAKQIKKYIIKDVFKPYYDAWLPIRAKIMEANGQEHTSIFITRDGKPATTHTIRGWFEKWDEFLDIPFYPHALRHYITTYLSKLSLEPDLIVEIMGWNDTIMIKTYNDQTLKDKKWKNLGKLKDKLNGIESVPEIIEEETESV